MKFFKRFLTKNYAPRWLILQIDLLFVVLSVFVAYLIRFNFDLYHPEFSRFWLIAATFGVLRLFSFYFTKTYYGVVRYTSVQDAKRIFISLTGGTIFYGAANIIFYYNKGYEFAPFSIILAEYVLTAVTMCFFRLAVKLIYTEIKILDVDRKSVIIFGAGESGILTKRTIDHDKDSGKKVIAFLDDDHKKRFKTVEGLKIYNLEQDFNHLISKYKIDELVISVQKISRKRKEELVDLCLLHKIHVMTVPNASDWINGELSTKQIKEIKIEDLLERDPIQLDQDKISALLKDKVVMVTGACGSIGSELVRQIVKFYPEKIVLIDQAESPLYELELEMREKFGFIEFDVVIADIRNQKRMEEIFQKTNPEVVYHAGAYKHVPLMEEHPFEAINTNVRGTKILADLSVKYNVKKFVFVSTDKAVNPTNVMGASKRIAEIYVQSLNKRLIDQPEYGVTQFVTTRFGNVLGSNGSVIPRFRKQLENGGPITVTHPEICRYFMTIPEACQLILEAAKMGKGGEIFVFDMGEPVKIIDLAKKMISLAGLKIDQDVKIVFTGLRPGEKIKEELLNNKEKTLPTHHPKIMIGKVREYPFELVEAEINDLIVSNFDGNDQQTVSKMKLIVPEFVSNNSIFEKLDNINVTSNLKFD